MVHFTTIGMKSIFSILVLLLGLAALPVRAQYPVPPPISNYQPLSSDQLDQLLGPIALYPDPLIAEILPASTLPTQIVMADRYVSGGGDPGQIEQQPWDVSVQGLAHYPNVLSWLDQNLNWTTELGQAFINQQQDVMDSIQRLRVSAQNMGNLQSTPQQQVVYDNGTIEILPVDPEVVYVPVYQPAEVYYQGGYGLTFGVGFPIGIWLSGDCDWHHHHLIEWDRDHPRPHDWWHERPDQRDGYVNHHTTVWRPEDHRDNGWGNRGDRGWNNQPANRNDRNDHGGNNQPVPQVRTPDQNRPGIRFPQPDMHPPQPELRTPQPDRHPQPPHIVTPFGGNVNAPRPAAEPRPEGRPAAVPFESRPAPVPPQHYEPGDRPAANGAFIGVQSSQQTRDYSNRGQQSMQTVPHSAPPAPRPAPPAGNGGGGGGNHGQQPKQR